MAGAGAEGFSTITAADEVECLEAELVVDRLSASSSSSSTVGWCHDGDGVRLVLALVVGVSWPRGSISVSVSTCGDADDVE